jgi:hypothetical protein
VGGGLDRGDFLFETADDAMFAEFDEIDRGIRFDMGADLDDLAGVARAHQQGVDGLIRERAVVEEVGGGAFPKASSPAHAEENAGAGDLRLSGREIAKIDEAFPRGPRPRRLPTL